MPYDDDTLDGCEIDFTAYADDDLTSELRAFFPDGKKPTIIRRALNKVRSLGAGTGRDTGIADRLRAAGLKVVEISGWQTRGSSTFSPRGSVDHHTAGGATGNAPSLGICINGRSDLPGPLCNVLIGRDNTCYVIAAGRANHAGTGGWKGLSGNTTVYGIERENRGTAVEPWREDQTDTAAKAHAALIRGRANADMVCEHKEWAPGRKIDAHTITGPDMRIRVNNYLNPPPPVPAPTPTPTDWKSRLRAKPELRLGANGWDVRALQGALCAHATDLALWFSAGHLGDFVDGDFGNKTDYVLSAWQDRTGALGHERSRTGPDTWAWLGGEAPTLSANSPDAHHVKLMQGMMVAHGMPDQEVDGVFGIATLWRLTDWQKRTGVLAPDGVCGPKTWSWFFGV